jgi:subtilisin family serine protease
MKALELVRLTTLMARTSGRAEIVVGLIDGPVSRDHPDLAGASIREVAGGRRANCFRVESAACFHGTFVAGILFGRRQSAAPAICPGCTLVVRPIFPESPREAQAMPTAAPEELATAIGECIAAGTRVLNLSVGLARSGPGGERQLDGALNLAARLGVLVVAAAGNQGVIGSSAITRHPWVVPVTACDQTGTPLPESNLGRSIGRNGLRAPGKAITSLAAGGTSTASGGTSVAAPFVSGALALLWSEFPDAAAADLKEAVTPQRALRRVTVIPPLLNAWESYHNLVKNQS